MTGDTAIPNARKRELPHADAILLETLERMARDDRRTAFAEPDPKKRRRLRNLARTWERYGRDVGQCGKRALLLVCEQDGQQLFYPRHCHRRAHASCAPYVRRRAEEKASRVLERFRHRPLFLTLTAVSEGFLEPMLDRITKAFQKLRRCKLWKRHVRGGLAAHEITHTRAGWHVHIHALLDARFLPREQLVEEWQRILGCRCRRPRNRRLPVSCCRERLEHLGSARDPDRDRWTRCDGKDCPCQGCGVHPAAQDIRRADQGRSAVHELVKYACKDLGHAKGVTADTRLLEELLRALHGRRMSTTFGEHYGNLPDPPPTEHPRCEQCASRDHWVPRGWVRNPLGQDRPYQIDPRTGAVDPADRPERIEPARPP